MDWSPGYREWAPPAALAGPVSCLWASVTPDAGAPAELVLPDACVDVMWQQDRGVFIAGPDTGPVPAARPAGTTVAGVRLAPGAAGLALGLPLRALLTQRVDAADLGSAALTRLARRAPGSSAPDCALRELVAAVGAMTANGGADRMVAAAAGRLARPQARVAEVAADLGVSERQLRRRCEAAVGYGPTTLRRVLRFRRFVAWVDSLGAAPDRAADRAVPGRAADRAVPGRAARMRVTQDRDARRAGFELAAIAADIGFADQAHLTRDCAEFSGLTPARLIAARAPSAAASVWRPPFTWMSRNRDSIHGSGTST